MDLLTAPEVPAPAPAMRPPKSITALASRPRPVILQVRHNGGLWHRVAEFDAQAYDERPEVDSAIRALASLDGRTQFRLCMAGSISESLMKYCAAQGWSIGGSD